MLLKNVWYWLSFNKLQENASKYYLFVSPYQTVLVNIAGSIIEVSDCETLLGIFIDINFSFECHIKRICCKAWQKLHRLHKIAKYNSELIKEISFFQENAIYKWRSGNQLALRNSQKNRKRIGQYTNLGART